jgi:type II secretory pathway pseudopilin PulG
MMHFKPKNRPAFSMLTAIFVIVIMATVAGFIMNLSGKMVQETVTQYKKEQAILYAKSYTEYAIMAATAQNCVKTITADLDGITSQVEKGQGYHVQVDVQYVGNSNPQGCGNVTPATSGSIADPKSIGAIILVDTYVKYRDTDTVSAFMNHNTVPVTATNLPWVTYHRRTLQRL